MMACLKKMNEKINIEEYAKASAEKIGSSVMEEAESLLLDKNYLDDFDRAIEQAAEKLRVPDMFTDEFMNTVKNKEFPKSFYMIRSENGYFKDGVSNTTQHEFDVPFNHGTMFTYPELACTAANRFKNSKHLTIEAYFITQESSRWKEMDIENDDISYHAKTETTINLAKDFSTTPSGRTRKDSPFSGEEFRGQFLLEPLKSNSKLLVILDGTRGYGSSFLDEAFGGLIKCGLTKEILHELLELECQDKSVIYEIWSYIDDFKINKEEFFEQHREN